MLFAEVQSAYEILSDVQERAWYDSHRNEVLRGDDEVQGNHYEHDVRVTTTEDIMRMLPKINASRDFSNSPAGFYSMLKASFDTLAREEELACEWEDLDPIAYPGFGNANDQYDSTVRSFYSAWSNFVTRKAFSWVDLYRYSEAPDRRIRRLMEKENRRLRDEAIREFNDAVRSLVAFVKKRDPRFQPTVQSEAERQKVLNAALAQAARSRAANQAKVEESAVPRWAQPEDLASSEESDPTEEAPKEMYECVVCKKFFKSEKQFEAHERSKKHVKAAERIRREMQYEDRNLNLAQQTHEEPVTDFASVPSTSESTPGDAASDALKGGVEDLSLNDISNSVKTGNAHEGVPNDTSPTMAHRGSSADHTSTSSSDDVNANRKKIEQRILGQEKNLGNGGEHDEAPPKLNGSTAQASIRDSDSDDGPVPQRKLGKAKARRAKKATQKPATGASPDAQVSSPHPRMEKENNFSRSSSA